MRIEHVNIEKHSEKEKRSRKRRNQIDRRRQRKFIAEQRRRRMANWHGTLSHRNYEVEELQVTESIAICELCGKVGGDIFAVCSTCTGEAH